MVVASAHGAMQLPPNVLPQAIDLVPANMPSPAGAIYPVETVAPMHPGGAMIVTHHTVTTHTTHHHTSISPSQIGCLPDLQQQAQQHLEYHSFLMHHQSLQAQQQSLQAQAHAHAQAHWNAQVHLMQQHAAQHASLSRPPSVPLPLPSNPYVGLQNQLGSRHQWQQQQHEQFLHQQQQVAAYHQQERHSQEQLQRAMQQSMDTALPSRAASAAAIEQLRSENLTEIHLATKPSCVICITEFELGEERVIMPCEHGYHRACLKTWLSIRNTCCVCRHQLPTDDEAYNRTMQQPGQTATSIAPNTAVASAQVFTPSPASAAGAQAPSHQHRRHASSFSETDMDESEDDDDETLSDEEEEDHDVAAPSTALVHHVAPPSVPISAPSVLLTPLPQVGASSTSAALLQYHTLHHLQAMAAAEFAALAREAQRQQQQQQLLIYYQQALWSAQRSLQTALGPALTNQFPMAAPIHSGTQSPPLMPIAVPQQHQPTVQMGIPPQHPLQQAHRRAASAMPMFQRAPLTLDDDVSML
jgi:hypothetical protein